MQTRMRKKFGLFDLIICSSAIVLLIIATKPDILPRTKETPLETKPSQVIVRFHGKDQMFSLKDAYSIDAQKIGCASGNAYQTRTTDTRGMSYDTFALCCSSGEEGSQCEIKKSF
ncbi:hypothetical protein HYV70_05740 [Candidatus Uhrbacteria bacterium]|nr:hypothetical protein [Candidatus Uhrbacteria bacterium]